MHNFTHIEISQVPRRAEQKANALNQYVLYVIHPKGIFFQRELNTAKLSFRTVKVQLFFDICKKNVYFFDKEKKSALAMRIRKETGCISCSSLSI